MGAYVENAHAGEGVKDTAFVWKDEQAQPEADEDSSMALAQEKKENYNRRGFYFSAGLSIGYSSLSNTEGDDGYHGKSVQKFSGLSFPFFETRFGIYIAKIVSVYGAFGFGIGTGTYEVSSKRKDTPKIDASSMRALIGLGAEIYPFQDKEDALYGLHLGFCVGGAAESVQADTASVGRGVGYTYNTTNEDLDLFDNTFARIEIGYDFWLGKRWRIGTAISYAFGKYDTDEDNSLITESHNIGLGIRIAR